jgi:hypothetical protein
MSKMFLAGPLDPPPPSDVRDSGADTPLDQTENFPQEADEFVDVCLLREIKERPTTFPLLVGYRNCNVFQVHFL